ncbi:MAG: pyruvate kinase [Rhabdochlamydiaceae bacterium]|nr:pyruvate kinase [Candidatus Amphrikana amoebophyrae]
MSRKKKSAKTKIICTLGPACNSKEKILELIAAGMDVARINFSHGTHAEHKETIAKLKEAREERDVPLAIMLDTKGPEIRVCKIQNNEIAILPGMRLTLIKDDLEISKPDEIAIYPGIVLDQLEVNIPVLFDDGTIKSKVVEKQGDRVVVEFYNPGLLKNHKGVNVPHGGIQIPAVTDKDIEDIKFGCEQDVDLIAASFVCNAEQVLQIKRLLNDFDKPNIMVMAKIESYQGVKNFESIVHVSDGIMVARGDLGVEMPIEQVPKLQKEFILKSYRVGKPVAIATQMLESMMVNPTPTRAEVSDVANAIYDSASCVMLSGETAVGHYPIETVKMMRKIIDETEKCFKYRDYFYHQLRNNFYDVSSSVSAACVKTAYSADAKGIIVCTIKGATARSISRFRPALPILAITPLVKTYHQLAVNWGVIPILQKAHTVSEAIHYASCYAMENKLLNYGDLIVVSAGSPFNVSGSTNMMIVDIIGDVLVRGEGHGKHEKVYGQVHFVLTPERKALYSAKNKIVILSACTDEYSEILKNAKGIILQNHPEDLASEEVALHLATKYDLPIITRADNALSILQENQFVTLESGKGIVFKGSTSSEDDLYSDKCKYHNQL